MSKGTWAPHGVADLGPGLPPTSREHLTTVLDSAGFPRDRIGPFLDEVDLAVGAYRAGQALRRRTLPATVRANLRKAVARTYALRDTLNALDGLSRDLINRERPDALEAIDRNLFEIVSHLAAARRRAAALPSGGGRLKEHEGDILAAHVAWAVREHLGVAPTAAANGIYAQVLATVVEAVDAGKGQTKRRRKGQSRDVGALMIRGLDLPFSGTADGLRTGGAPVG